MSPGATSSDETKFNHLALIKIQLQFFVESFFLTPPFFAAKKKFVSVDEQKKDFLAPKMDSVTYSFFCGNEHFENLISFLGHDELL